MLRRPLRFSGPSRSPSQSPAPDTPISRPSTSPITVGTVGSPARPSPPFEPITPEVYMDLTHRRTKKVLFIGGTMVDNLFTFTGDPLMGDCAAAQAKVVIGGVALNSARIFMGLGDNDVSMMCVVGKDLYGDGVVAYLREIGIEPAIVIREPDQATASFAGLHNKDGDVFVSAASKQIYQLFNPEKLKAHLEVFIYHDTWVLDSSYSPAVYHFLSSIVTDQRIHLTVCGSYEGINFLPILPKAQTLFGNKLEIMTLAENLSGEVPDDILTALKIVARTGVKSIFATDGANGVYVRSAGETYHFPAPAAHVVCVNGAGDAFMAATIDALILEKDLAVAVESGQVAAKCQIEGRPADIKRTFALEESVASDPMPQLTL